jgi:electron transport complex protein RnfG
MNKLSSSLQNMTLSLTVICVAAGTTLSALNETTKADIEASRKAKLENAILKVVPAFDNSPVNEAYTVESDGTVFTVYPAKKGGQAVGAAIESASSGFSGEISVIVGIDSHNKLLNYSVIKHTETPGLGSKMEDWFRSDKPNRNILGKDLSKGALRVTKDGGGVDGITAATISSRAFLDAINKAYNAYSGNTDGNSSATENYHE